MLDRLKEIIEEQLEKLKMLTDELSEEKKLIRRMEEKCEELEYSVSMLQSHIFNDEMRLSLIEDPKEREELEKSIEQKKKMMGDDFYVLISTETELETLKAGVRDE